MKNLLKSNWFTIAASILSAVIIWIYVVYQINPTFETTIKNIPITYSRYSEDFDNGKLTVLSAGADTVNVKIKGRRSQLAKVTRDNISCSVNMSDVDSDGTYKLPINVSFDVSGVEVVSKDPYNVGVNVDKVVTEEKDITVETKGTPADGYVYDTIEYAADKIRLTGAKSIIKTVKKARIYVDITGKSESISGRYKIVLLDKKNNEITDERISKNISYVELKCNILKLKEVDITAELTSGETYEGKKVSVASVSPASINVLGGKNALSSIEKIKTEKIDVSFAKDKDKVKVKLEALPQNVKPEKDIETVEVTLKVE